MTDTTIRHAELRKMLHERRRELQVQVQSRMRDERSSRAAERRDELEDTEADVQGDLTFALLQMQTETVTRIDEALKRLDAGQYGACFDCGGEVAERRLRALPFAVRCQSCEERREQDREHARRLADRRGDTLLTFPSGAKA